MKCLASFACLSVFVVVIYAAPAPQFGGSSISASASVQAGTSPSASPIGGLTNILQNIDLPGLLRGVNSFVGLVRQFCPPLSQILDNVIQNVTSQAFRIFGRVILQSGGLGGVTGGGAPRVNVVLPTFPPDDYDDEEEESSEETVDLAGRIGNTQESTTPTLANDNAILKRHTREAAEADTDQELAESAPEPQDDLSNVDTESDSDRGKRFLPFGGDGHGGGSGNFLFDIIRSTADMTGRAVGTFYRLVAGTDSVGFGFEKTSSRQLVAGSGATEEVDAGQVGAGGVAEIDIAKGADGYTEGIPGPITRLFVIANRGIANLVQDLILRLAQTSERLVNFKARLVTALI